MVKFPSAVLMGVNLDQHLLFNNRTSLKALKLAEKAGRQAKANSLTRLGRSKSAKSVSPFPRLPRNQGDTPWGRRDRAPGGDDDCSQPREGASRVGKLL